MYWGFIKDEKELGSLTIDELILIYFKTISEVKNPHIKIEGGNPYRSYEIKTNYIEQHQNQAMEIIKILKSKRVKTNHFYLKYKYIQLKHIKK